jgi:DNA-binding PadR family transcriptional regulator
VHGERAMGDILPLKPALFQILVVLADGERHGYGIMQEIAARDESPKPLGPGTLYRSIKQLLADGLIEESAERPDPALDDERRRYYRLTALGEQVAQAELERLERLVRLARSRRLLGASRVVPGGA